MENFAKGWGVKVDNDIVLDVSGAGPKPNPMLGINTQADFHRLILAPIFAELGITTNEQTAKVMK